jgi:hypothetical protein
MATQPPPSTFNPQVAYITAADESIFQVLNEDGTDWDEAATQADYAEYLASKGLPE